MIYQQFVPSADVQQETDNGEATGKYTYSCFVINGKASETFVRLQPGEITGVEAYFVPVSMKYKNLRNIRNEYPSISIFFDCCTVPQLYAGCEIS